MNVTARASCPDNLSKITDCKDFTKLLLFLLLTLIFNVLYTSPRIPVGKILFIKPAI
jgi:hypothetical protein